MTTKGRCLCGRVEVTIDKPLSSVPTLMCHCTSCKRRSGGLASYAFLIPQQHVHITSDEDTHVEYADNDTGSGTPMQRSMCARCGSPVRIIEGSAPETWCMQYGLFAGEVELPPPKVEMFRSRACGWVRAVGEDVRETM